MQWKKLGLVYCPDQRYPWMQTHASTPFPVHLGEHRYRVYFSTRDKQNQSSITFLELELLPTPRVTRLPEQAVISPGEQGAFDDSGVTMSQIVSNGGDDYLYYQGWSLAAKVPFRCGIGMAIAPHQTTSFSKYTKAPVLDRNPVDPFSLSYPWIIKEQGLWRMWYGSNLCWERDGLDVQHVIKYAESDDGIHWDRKDVICIPLNPGESGVVRPCLLKTPDIYMMWYSIRIGRKETYRLGYAESKDGVHWQRKDSLAGLKASEEGWDSEMVCYPCVFEHQGQRFMLYNGNGFGRTGFGLAVWG